MKMPGFTADESLSPARGNYRAHAGTGAARFAVLPQMQSVIGNYLWQEFWTSLVTGSGQTYSGGDPGGSNFVIDSCVWTCWFAHKADLIECENYDSPAARERCRIDSATRYLDCCHECSIPYYPWNR